MFKKILIANRGEIACRVIATARRMGILTVAVYSDADKDAPHVGLADEAVRIGPAAPAESYLVVENIVAACKKTGAEAVHPGYGFLSERAEFARAVIDNDIAFIGPNPKAIEAMGDKIESKKLARAAGVATVPGFLGVIKDITQATKIADDIGYPVMIKASAGGGGRGMRSALTREELDENFARAQSEAKTSFGDDRLFIEKFILHPRHIEIQVLGDKFGAIVHLGERECSIQRRHQKLIEESPSPFIDEETRGHMGEQAIALAKAVDYDSAGTVEFIVAPDKSFYFLEMNTRLQVEHPVTELVTGIDLVEQMIKMAYGERLSIGQKNIHLKGSAIESRVLAEDPTRNFLPSTGRLKTYRPPANAYHDGVTLRVDTGVREGSEIGIHYDPMIAKVITHASDRQTAIEAQGTALDQFFIDGISHNIFFLAASMRNKRFRGGDISTGFIEQEYPRGFAPLPPDGDRGRLLASVAASLQHVIDRRKRFLSGQTRRLPPDPSPGNYSVFLGKKRQEVILTQAGDGLVVRFEKDGQAHHCVSAWAPGEPVWNGTLDGNKIAVQLRSILNGYTLAHAGAVVDARVYSRRQAELAELMLEKRITDSSKLLRCPMPGLVKSIDVAAGQTVKSGEALCVIEAMKMETVLRADEDAVVKKINVKPGDSIAVDAIIMTFV